MRWRRGEGGNTEKVTIGIRREEQGGVCTDEISPPQQVLVGFPCAPLKIIKSSEPYGQFLHLNSVQMELLQAQSSRRTNVS